MEDGSRPPINPEPPRKAAEPIRKGAAERFSPLVQQLTASGDIHVLSPGFGKNEDQLDDPVSAATLTLNDKEYLAVSNQYGMKGIQIFDTEGKFIRSLGGIEYANSAALTANTQGELYAVNKDGDLTKFSPTGEKAWQVKIKLINNSLPIDMPLSNIGLVSMIATDTQLYVFNKSKQTIMVIDPNEGKLEREITLADLNSLATTDQKMAFSPETIKVVLEKNSLRTANKNGDAIYQVQDIPDDDKISKNYIQVLKADTLEQSFRVPGCPEAQVTKAGNVETKGTINSIQTDPTTGDLIVCHSGTFNPRFKFDAPMQTRSIPQNYAEVIRLSPKAIADLIADRL